MSSSGAVIPALRAFAKAAPQLVRVSRPPVSPPRVSARRDPPAPAFPIRISQPSSLARPPPPPDGVDAPARGSPGAVPRRGRRDDAAGHHRGVRCGAPAAGRRLGERHGRRRASLRALLHRREVFPVPRASVGGAGNAGRRAREPGRAPRLASSARGERVGYRYRRSTASIDRERHATPGDRRVRRGVAAAERRGGRRAPRDVENARARFRRDVFENVFENVRGAPRTATWTNPSSE